MDRRGFLRRRRLGSNEQYMYWTARKKKQKSKKLQVKKNISNLAEIKSSIFSHQIIASKENVIFFFQLNHGMP
jgi:hypothetical protein